MATPDLTKSLPSQNIKNGASVLNVTKAGQSITFDNSQDIENGLEVFANLINNRFDETLYYAPWGTPS
jgi:hypothetical protein